MSREDDRLAPIRGFWEMFIKAVEVLTLQEHSVPLMSSFNNSEVNAHSRCIFPGSPLKC